MFPQAQSCCGSHTSQGSITCLMYARGNEKGNSNGLKKMRFFFYKELNSLLFKDLILLNFKEDSLLNCKLF